MNYFKRVVKSRFWASIIIIFLGSGTALYGQVKEPDVREINAPQTPLQKGFTNRIGGGILINNFGFGISGVYSHAIGPLTEVTFSTEITGIRDVTEQSFTNYFTGQRVVPHKYNRAFGIPLMFGIKRRFFARQVADNFRFFVAASGGPAFAFVYPYINDKDGNGYRSSRLVQDVYGREIKVYTERENDFFSGWGDGSGKWGAAGELKLGIDLGSNFKRQSTLEIGYFFYYFNQGIQMLEPFRPEGYDSQGYSAGQKPFFGDQKFFGTPQIKFSFSGWW